MLALVHADETLEDALRTALGGALAPHRRRRLGQDPSAVHCLVCHAAARRERAIDGGWLTACEQCGSVLEEPSERPQLRLL
jgi:hypothetical protein